MDDIVALCRRRGFVWQSSEIYGGINGFWDYGPLGAQLKRNLKDAWWQDIIQTPPSGPDGNPLSIVPVDCTIIMNPKVWQASGHVGGFNDPMVDDKETKRRFRADHIWIRELAGLSGERKYVAISVTSEVEARSAFDIWEKTGKPPKELKLKLSKAARKFVPPAYTFKGRPLIFTKLPEDDLSQVLWPEASEFGTLTMPRQFNLMFQTYHGAVFDEEHKTYLRPETAQGIFTEFWNVVDTMRVKVPFGMAQIGKAFRNEVTPRNFTFRSREFEQMELEFFVHPSEASQWYPYWRDNRYRWWQSIGLSSDNLQLREHDQDELAHYAKEGSGCSDVEYRFPFTAPGFGELEGVADRTDYDLRQHAEYSGKGDKLKYFDQDRKERYFPHVIEPSAGADRGSLALICEAYTPDDSRASKVYMNFTPRMAPIKAAVYPLVNKDGMPEIAWKLYMQLRRNYPIEFSVKQSIGKRYARMDEAGTPYCFTIDGQTLEDQTITVRNRDTQQQERIAIDKVAQFLAGMIGD